LVCDDFTRPWADRPTRYWIHDSKGEVATHTATDRQERAMIETLITDASLASYQRHALQTQIVLDGLARSSTAGTPVNIPPLSP